jgi:hypothetical protein
MLLERHDQNLLDFWLIKGAFLTARTWKDVKSVCRGPFKVLSLNLCGGIEEIYHVSYPRGLQSHLEPPV